VPVARHALLISDNPPSRAPRLVRTAADGTVAVSLAPGSYIVESDTPVAFAGKGYQWTATVDVVAGRDTTLALTAQNADVVPITSVVPDRTAAAVESDPVLHLAKWRASLVAIWSPTSLATGFVVDDRGLIATDRHQIGTATSVEVQLSANEKVAARVLVADPAQDVAIVWVDPAVLKQAPPLPLACPPAAAPARDEGDEVIAMAASLRSRNDVIDGEITGFLPRGIETDLRLSFGDAGGPVFAHDLSVVGLTSIGPDAELRPRREALVVRAGIICEARSAARAKMSGAPPASTALPVEPEGSYPAEAARAPAGATPVVSTPPVVSSSGFEVAFITPSAVLQAREKADWSGGRSVRPLDAEARLGRLTEFGPWAQYFADVPPVLVVRVAPKLVEGFWMRLAREAARTQGAALPPLKDFKTNFLRLRASCGAVDVAPIHPFVLEHAITDKRVVREGLYVFSPDAFGPHCGSVTLTLSSEEAPDRPETVTLDPKVIAQIWEDFAPYRSARK
jgi:hypothetical protein